MAIEGTADEAEHGVGRRARLLIVDDDPDISEILARILRHSYDVDAVGGVDAALERVRGGVCYDLVLCDLAMPGRTGVELYRELCERDPDLATRVVFITGASASPDLSRFLQEVPNARLLKPFHPRELQALIQGNLRATQRT